MSKICEICGRPIRTGKKYCWEHRYTAQAEKNKTLQREEKIIEDANIIYLTNFVNKELKLHDNFRKGEVARLWRSRRKVESLAREKAWDNMNKKTPDYVKEIKDIISNLKNSSLKEENFKRQILGKD